MAILPATQYEADILFFKSYVNELPFFFFFSSLFTYTEQQV